MQKCGVNQSVNSLKKDITKSRIWKLKVVLQIHRWNYDSYHGPYFKSENKRDLEEGYRNETQKPSIDDEGYLDLMLDEVDWTDRMRITRDEINTYINSECEKIFKVVKGWFIYDEDDDYKDPVSIEKEILVLSHAHTPALHLTILYGPTKHSIASLTKIINEAFEHWSDAGDQAFTIVSMRWKEQVSKE